MCRHSGVTRLCKSASVSYGKRRHGVRRGRRTISRPIHHPSLPLRDGVCSGSIALTKALSCRATTLVDLRRAPAAILGGRPKPPDGLRTRLADLFFLAVERLGELLDSAGERVSWRRQRRSRPALGRPAIQAASASIRPKGGTSPRCFRLRGVARQSQSSWRMWR